MATQIITFTAPLNGRGRRKSINMPRRAEIKKEPISETDMRTMVATSGILYIILPVDFTSPWGLREFRS